MFSVLNWLIKFDNYEIGWKHDYSGRLAYIFEFNE